MIIENLSEVTVLDGNGDIFDEGRRYFNRYQSTLPHEIRNLCLFLKRMKTVGGFIFTRPAVRCEIVYPNYAGGRTRRNHMHFESDFIKDGVYGFPQMIPVEKGIKLEFDYGERDAYAKAVMKKTLNGDENLADDREEEGAK